MLNAAGGYYGEVQLLGEGKTLRIRNNKGMMVDCTV